MNLNQLRVFHAVAQTGSISAAARRLHVSQPAVSKQLAEFEASLGTELFDRLPRGVRLTPSGRRLVPHAARLFQIERAAEEDVELFRSGQTVRLAIGASTTIGSYLVPSLFGSLRRLHPEVQLSLEIGNTHAIHELVRTDRVDLGLTEGLVVGDDLESEAFSEDELVALVPPGDPLVFEGKTTLARLLERPLVVREPGSGTREVLESALAERGLEMRPTMELGSNEAVKNAVAHRLGVAFLSSLAVDLELRSGRLAQIEVSDLSLKRRLHWVTLRHRKQSPITRVFRRLLERPPTQLRATEYAI